MAQHIPIIENNLFPKVQEAVLKRFSKKNIGLASFRYRELPKDYIMFPNCKVFLNIRKIQKEEELFEIHFDTEERIIKEIYWIK